MALELDIGVCSKRFQNTTGRKKSFGDICVNMHFKKVSAIFCNRLVLAAFVVVK